MSDLIHLLPESLANQIAAGEVIQRPASVVKELLENAVDAQADKIELIIKDAGRTLIQVIDSGLGMSSTDARMAFERHATSKISKSEDLFAISTRGFRGEALASIAAVAHVELKTRKQEDELGTELIIAASEVKSQNDISCSGGSNFTVRNLFYNVPARRKFLKSNPTELRHIQTELKRVALVNPEVEFSFIHNDDLLSHYTKGNLKQRISQVIKKSYVQSSLPIEVDTEIVRLYGFVAKPEYARKTQNDQYFFVNGRYMRNPYFHKAVTMAYERIISPDVQPSYFIYMEVDPSEIDVNIHPTKTEIKFADASNVFQILLVAIKEALGKFDIMPAIDFNQEGNWGINSPKKGQKIVPPQEEFNPGYNPFEEIDKEKRGKENKNSAGANVFQSKDNYIPEWQKLYEGFENQEQEEIVQTEIFQSKLSAEHETVSVSNFLQFKGDFIVTSVRSGLMLIHIRRAFERVLFDNYFSELLDENLKVQALLYPEELELADNELNLLKENSRFLNEIGMNVEFTRGKMIINSLPQGIESTQIKNLTDELLIGFENEQLDAKEVVVNHLANSLAKAGSGSLNRQMSIDEMQDLSAKLFACSSPNFTYDGKKIIHIIAVDELINYFK